VLAEIDSPLDAELWGSDIVAALGSGGQATLRVLGAVGSPGLGAAASAAAARLASRGISDPAWAASIGAPSPGECWRYGDAVGQQEAVTATFWYGERGHVLSVLLDLTRGGGIKDVWVGASADILDRTRDMARQDPRMIFKMITQADARAWLDRAIAAGECPQQPEEAGNVVSRRALLRARAALLRR
jgi:hypothetical protein